MFIFRICKQSAYNYGFAQPRMWTIGDFKFGYGSSAVISVSIFMNQSGV
jgi:hypothetical protein